MMRLKNIAVAAGAGLAAVLGPMAPAATADVVSDASAHVTGEDATIVVLGARLNPGLCVPPAVLDERLNAAAVTAHAHPGARVFATGGYTQDFCPAEAHVMTAGLIARGVAPWRIDTDTSAMSTVGNAHGFAASGNTAPTVYLVTSGDHMPRAVSTFESEAPGHNYIPAPSS